MKSKQEKIKQAQLAAIQSKLNNEMEQTKNGSNSLKTKRNVDKIIKNTASQIVQKKWWPQDDQQGGQSDAQDDNKKWKNMEHHGIIFAQEYKPHNIPAYYKGQQLKLNIFQEEALSWWAQALGTDFAQKPHVRKNVLKQLRNLFDDKKIQSLEEIDVSNIKAHIVEENQKRKKRDQAQKKAELAERKKFQEYYQFALIDGEIEKIDNCMIEPPGLFRGRGEHPKAGTFKSRIYPQAFTVNCGQNDPIPKCNVPGHCWKAVVHNHDATWLGSYKDDKRNHMKYMFLAANSKFKGKNDMKKYEKARVLKDHIKEIRGHYNDLMKKGDLTQKQLATATYLIDFLALRVGNQKGQDEADTVGCCSLRVEHLVFEDPQIEEDDQKKFKITFDFLGKDSMRYFNTVSVSELAYKNLKSFAKDKDPKQDLFHMINAGKLNDFLKKFMKNLSAKVFRTYNASVTLQNELSKQKMTRDQVKQVEPKLEYYNKANRQVAILCNHQKTVAKNFDEQVDKLKNSLQSRKQKLEILKQHQDNLKRKNKSESKQQAAEKRAKKASLKLPKTLQSVKKSIQQASKSLLREEKKLQTKEENRNISLLTSRLNYMDPRISIAWCKRVELPIEKVFTQKMRDKFCWGMDIEPQFKF